MALVDSTTAALSTYPLMDPSITDGLRAALGDGVDKIIAKSAGMIDDRLSQLAAQADKPLDEGVARLAHEIGGMAGQVGLTRLSKASLALEQASRAGDAGAAMGLWREVSAIADETRALVPA